MPSFQLLKKMSKENMRSTKPSIYKASLLLFVITIILSLLIAYLSGYDRYLTNMNNIMNELSQKSELLENPTDEFLDKLSAQLEAAIPKLTPFAVILLILIILMYQMLDIGFAGYCLKVIRHEDAKARDIMRSFEYPLKSFALLIIRTLATAIGAIFFIIPGLIAYYSFSQCFMVMYDHPEYSVFRCLKESSRLMKRRKMLFLTLQLSFILWYFLDNVVSMLVSVPLLSIYTAPYKSLTYAHFYNALLSSDTTAQ